MVATHVQTRKIAVYQLLSCQLNPKLKKESLRCSIRRIIQVPARTRPERLAELTSIATAITINFTREIARLSCTIRQNLPILGRKSILYLRTLATLWAICRQRALLSRSQRIKSELETDWITPSRQHSWAWIAPHKKQWSPRRSVQAQLEVIKLMQTILVPSLSKRVSVRSAVWSRARHRRSSSQTWRSRGSAGPKLRSQLLTRLRPNEKTLRGSWSSSKSSKWWSTLKHRRPI